MGSPELCAPYYGALKQALTRLNVDRRVASAEIAVRAADNKKFVLACAELADEGFVIDFPVDECLWCHRPHHFQLFCARHVIISCKEMFTEEDHGSSDSEIWNHIDHDDCDQACCFTEHRHCGGGDINFCDCVKSTHAQEVVVTLEESTEAEYRYRLNYRPFSAKERLTEAAALFEKWQPSPQQQLFDTNSYLAF